MSLQSSCSASYSGYSNQVSILASWPVSLLRISSRCELNTSRVVTVQWFLAEEQAIITTIWQLMFVLANFIASLLAYGFYQINGASGDKQKGLYTWQWMTLCIAIISGIASGEPRRRTQTQRCSSG